MIKLNLIVDTSFSEQKLILFNEQGKVLAYQKRLASNSHYEHLFDNFDTLMLGYELTQLNNIIIVNGPGSFTGLRIGLMFAKTLAIELKINL